MFTLKRIARRNFVKFTTGGKDESLTQSRDPKEVKKAIKDHVLQVEDVENEKKKDEKAPGSEEALQSEDFSAEADGRHFGREPKKNQS